MSKCGTWFATVGMNTLVCTVGTFWTRSAIIAARLRNSATIAASSCSRNQSKAATRRMISSFPTFIPRPTVFEFGELFSCAASIKSFFPKSNPLHCGPRMPFPPEKATSEMPPRYSLLPDVLGITSGLRYKPLPYERPVLSLKEVCREPFHSKESQIEQFTGGQHVSHRLA